MDTPMNAIQLNDMTSMTDSQKIDFLMIQITNITEHVTALTSFIDAILAQVAHNPMARMLLSQSGISLPK